ncbi:Nicotianamine synthase [Actinidia chinensis var. chinensis]|uniref:Nicotianamine synthase n=1 Tax=Actinidia chinensis var. chinensis TaxID=1590841 RepID=A0A2R6R145_ACTCC|nr:Nicotianamine synthase [Actinidia chinensis var. chinensis]
MGCQEELLVEKVCEIYDQISRLETLKPSKDVNMLFTQLVLTCMPPCPNLDLTKLSKTVQEIRSKLIRLCGEAEGLLETHFSSLLGSLDNPLDNLNLFPYFSNYLKLSHLEFTILRRHSAANACPARAAFVGSGPLPLTSIVLAKNHLPTTAFHNYDIDPLANSLASRLVETDPNLSKHMFFHTTNILDVTTELKDYEVVFLAALVGMNKEEKIKVIDHLEKYMAPGAILMVRSAHGARAFLYPVVDSCDLRGFEVLSVFHPTDEVINSVVIARKLKFPMHSSLDHEGLAPLMLPCKCSDQIQAFCPLNHEVAIEEHLS